MFAFYLHLDEVFALYYDALSILKRNETKDKQDTFTFK